MFGTQKTALKNNDNASNWDIFRSCLTGVDENHNHLNERNKNKLPIISVNPRGGSNWIGFLQAASLRGKNKFYSGSSAHDWAVEVPSSSKAAPKQRCDRRLEDCRKALLQTCRRSFNVFNIEVYASVRRLLSKK